MHLLKSNIIYSNFGDLLNPENNDQFHSLTIIHLMLWIFFNIKSHQNTECWYVLCRISVSLLETLINREHDYLLKVTLGYNYIDMLIFDTFFSDFL